MDISQEKQLLRQSIKERLSHVNEKERQAESRSVCRRILENFPDDHQTVCAYYPMRTEVDILPLLTEILASGHELYLPRFLGKDFEYRKATDLRFLVSSSLNIPEPSMDADLLDPALATLALIPGVAFDKKGFRLGRGNGGYDRWLKAVREKNPGLKIWGVALDCQVVREVPVQAHDEPVDTIVTARELLRIR